MTTGNVLWFHPVNTCRPHTLSNSLDSTYKQMKSLTDSIDFVPDHNPSEVTPKLFAASTSIVCLFRLSVLLPQIKHLASSYHCSLVAPVLHLQNWCQGVVIILQWLYWLQMIKPSMTDKALLTTSIYNTASFHTHSELATCGSCMKQCFTAS